MSVNTEWKDNKDAMKETFDTLIKDSYKLLDPEVYGYDEVSALHIQELVLFHAKLLTFKRELF